MLGYDEVLEKIEEKKKQGMVFDEALHSTFMSQMKAKFNAGHLFTDEDLQKMNLVLDRMRTRAGRTAKEEKTEEPKQETMQVFSIVGEVDKRANGEFYIKSQNLKDLFEYYKDFRVTITVERGALNNREKIGCFGK